MANKSTRPPNSPGFQHLTITTDCVWVPSPCLSTPASGVSAPGFFCLLLRMSHSCGSQSQRDCSCLSLRCLSEYVTWSRWASLERPLRNLTKNHPNNILASDPETLRPCEGQRLTPENEYDTDIVERPSGCGRLQKNICFLLRLAAQGAGPGNREEGTMSDVFFCDIYTPSLTKAAGICFRKAVVFAPHGSAGCVIVWSPLCFERLGLLDWLELAPNAQVLGGSF